MFSEKGVPKVCSKFTGDYPCRSVISIKLQRNFIEIALRHECSPVNFLHIFRTTFLRTPYGGCFCHMIDMVDLCISSHPPSSHSQVSVPLLVSLHPRILISLCSCILACIVTSLHPHILRCMRPHLYPCILISSGSCVVASNLLSLHSLILRLVCSVCLLVSSGPHILVSLD